MTCSFYVILIFKNSHYVHMGRLFILLLLFSFSSNSFAKTWIAALNGSSKGNGTIYRPYDLNTAFGPGDGKNPRNIQPGDTIAIRGGTYVGSWWLKLYAKEGAPIVVMPFNGETVIFDTTFPEKEKYELNCAVKISGNHIIFRDFIFRSTIQDRVSAGTTNKSLGLNLRSGIYMYASNSKIINCVFHNLTSNGILWLAQSQNTELYGCLFMYNGWDGSDRGHGHAIYVRNDNPEKPKIIANNVFHNSMGRQISGYGEIQGIIVTNNVAFEGGKSSIHGPERNIFFGGSGRSKTIEDLVVTDNITYHRADGRGFEIGYIEANRKSAVVSHNIVLGGYSLVVKEGFEELELKDNLLKIEDMVKVQPNKYDPRKATITVLNKSQKDSLEIDFSALLPIGAKYKLIDYQNYFGEPVLEGVYDGGTIRVPLHLQEIKQPKGNIRVTLEHTPKEFNCFLLKTEQDMHANGMAAR